MKRDWINFVLVTAFGLSSACSIAQSNLLNAKVPDDIGKKTAAELNADNDKPLPYGYTMDRDILYSKRVWEIIDLDERINFPLYYPVGKDIGPDRIPLYDVLAKAISDSIVTEVYDDPYFTMKKTRKDIESSLVAIDTSDGGKEQMNEDYDAYKSGAKKIDEQFIVRTRIEADMVKGYKIMGLWYFDKRHGDLRYRILGICPIVPDVQVYKDNQDTDEYIELFWLYYPSIRDILHDAKLFNNRNSAVPFSFDHVLNSRRFSAVIYREENVYTDRDIKDYMKENAQAQLLEAERVKEKIRDFEQDMWNY